MLTLISAVLVTAASASAPIKVQTTPARQSSNNAAGFGKQLDQSAFERRVISISTASIRPDGTVELNCETHRSESPELERNERPK